MTQAIYGIDYEWQTNLGSSLLFTKSILWTEQDLVPMEKRMLTSYPISRLLPLEINEMNLQISLSYKLDAKKSLKQLTHNVILNEVDCLRILFTIVATIMDSKVHLLNEKSYLLEESFIYIGSDYLDVHLIYLPLYEFVAKPTLPQELLNILSFLLRKQGMSHSHNVVGIKAILNTTDFQLNVLKQKLLQAITEFEATIVIPDYIVHAEHSSQAASLQPSLNPKVTEADQEMESWMPLTFNEKLQNWRQTGSHNPILIMATIISLGIVWIFYNYYSSIGTLNLCLGLSLLIVNVSFWVNRSFGKLETSELTYPHSFEHSKLQQSYSNTPEADYYAQLSNQTTLLAPQPVVYDDATVMLARPKKAFLEFSQDEAVQLIEITGDSFIIGRNQEAAQFSADWLGLSRSHIMITTVGSDCEIKDLGSKNGSFLNEAVMEPHQNYQLNEGDCIKIVEKQFIYKKL